MSSGKVYLVGAGPGDPGLITLRAVEVLQRADIVFYDYLVNPAILRHCRPDSHLISLGQHGKGNLRTQAQINDRLHVAAQVFQHIVRLKGGDPMVFARAGEELDFLVEQDIPFEIVPGVTAALAAASYAGIPITHRDAASAVAFVTGRESDAQEGEAGREGEAPAEPSLDYAALAAFPGTLVFYMGVTTAEHWSQALIASGKPPTTPVAILRRVSLPEQKRIDTTLANVASAVKESKLRPPAVFIVGEVAAHGAAWTWFEKRPLFGRKVLVTRPAHQAVQLAAPLAELGAEILLQPAIKIYPPIIPRYQSPEDWIDRLERRESTSPVDFIEVVAKHKAAQDWAAVDRALDKLDQFDWIVFSSSNGVQFLLGRLLERRFGDLRVLGRLRIAAIGSATAEELAKYHLKADVVPNDFQAESLAKHLVNDAKGNRFLLARASRGREVLAEELTKAGGIVEQIVVYQSVDVEQPAPEIAQKMAAGQIDWTTVTSSAIARSLVRLFGDSLRKTKLVSISPITSATLRELGYEPAAEAREYTMAGVVNAILNPSEPLAPSP
jgi:uroporphyrinogen III methyltransferase/synthase